MAMDVYIQLVEQVDEDGEFIANLQRVGLHGPFESDVYAAIAELAK